MGVRAMILCSIRGCQQPARYWVGNLGREEGDRRAACSGHLTLVKSRGVTASVQTTDPRGEVRVFGAGGWATFATSVRSAGGERKAVAEAREWVAANALKVMDVGEAVARSRYSESDAEWGNRREK